jgi:hypothetical protein
VVEDGYEFFADRQLVTIFSAPNYCGEFDNAGAMMSVDDALMCSFQILKPAEKKSKYSYMSINSAAKSATPPRGAKVNFSYQRRLVFHAMGRNESSQFTQSCFYFFSLKVLSIGSIHNSNALCMPHYFSF